MAKPITLSHQVRSGGWESMISANGGLPAHRSTPQVTQRWPRGSEPASTRTPARACLDGVLRCRAPPASWCPFRCPLCCACVSALGSAGWAASGAPLHPTYPTCGTRVSCMVGVQRSVATSTHVWPAIPGQGPASARPLEPCSCADRLPAPDYPVRGARPPLVPG